MPRSDPTALFLGALELAVHRARKTETRDGAELLRDAMAVVGNDIAQRWKPKPLEHPIHDDRSVRTQRFLLRALEIVTSSARPSTTPGMSPGRRPTPETNACASSEAVPSE